jgi:Nuclease-related domain
MASPAGPFPDEYEPDDDEQPGVSIRPLSHRDLDAILAHLEQDRDSLLAGTPADRPVVAVRVRATVGRPGASAHATYQTRRAGELAGWLRGLPWRLAVTLSAGAVAGLLTPRLGLLAGVGAAGVAGWAVRFRTSPETRAWRRGATGERRTARLLGQLERHGWAVLHDLAVPGSRANIDHLVIGPGGVFVVDSKLYTGRLQLGAGGSLWHGRYPLAPVLRAVRFEADQAAQLLATPGVEVVPLLAVHGAQVPWGKLVVDGVPVVSTRRLPALLRHLPTILGPERVAGLANTARVRFHAAA